MSHNVGYARRLTSQHALPGDDVYPHEHQPRRNLRRRAVAAGKVESVYPRQTWNAATKQWDKEER